MVEIQNTVLRSDEAVSHYICHIPEIRIANEVQGSTIPASLHQKTLLHVSRVRLITRIYAISGLVPISPGRS